MENINDLTLYSVDEFEYACPHVWTESDRIIRPKKKALLNKFMTFDIETTSLVQESLGFMYAWTACIDGVCFLGRTWREYQSLIEQVESYLPENTNMVCYCHNLQFEFQFLRNFFTVEKVFAREKRNVISAQVGKIEYRCSYFLTNMSLKKFLENTPGVIHQKQDGDEYDYNKIRTPSTLLSNSELYYCVCDTKGLHEAITRRLELDKDNLATIPLTSTGYVRRDFSNACLGDKEHMSRFHTCGLTKHQYLLCKAAGRGAISGSNALLTDTVLENVHSYDIKSSYPYQMMTQYFPSSPFSSIPKKEANAHYRDYLEEYCCLMVVTFEEVNCRYYGGIPYIAQAKCLDAGSGVYGNGKVYTSRHVRLACTEIDLQIIFEQYDVKGMEIQELLIAERGMLSHAFRSTLHDMFQEKTDLEDGDPYLYGKFKNRINAAYGMMLTDVLRPDIDFNPNGLHAWTENKVSPFDMDRELQKYYKSPKSFLNYQDGIWILAHARESLWRGMEIVGSDIVQVDTDSVKFISPIKEHDSGFEYINERIISQSDLFDVPPYAMKNGKKHFLGVWEYEGNYPRFRTLGAKKYCYEDNDGDLHITVAGLNKAKAAKWLEKHGGIDTGFTCGTVVPPSASGRTAAVYNDELTPVIYEINGEEIEVGSNICIKPVDYTFGITGEWAELVMMGMIKEDAEFN